MPDSLRSTIDANLSELIAIRHDLHAHPELMFEEKRTSEVVQRELSALGIEFKPGLAKGTGVVAHLPATVDTEADAVALRADMDALPIIEATGRSYASTTPGTMHACGHDGHVAMLIGAARVLSATEHRPNPVTFVFQPAEEGGAGGRFMCDDGALLGASGGGVGPKVGRIFGAHGWPAIPLGVVSTRPGPLLAATDEFYITIRGVGGHAAYPHLTKDPVVAASGVVTALQTMASRAASPLDSLVCTVGRIAGGSANNVIPETVQLDGTIRTLRPETRRLAHDQLFTIAESVAAAHGCHAEVDFHEGYPVTHNDDALTEHFFGVARDALGSERVQLMPEPSMGGEDFSFYGKHVPACFFLLGLLPDGDDPMQTPLLHQPEFCRLATAEYE
jgi:amidohydrolase